MLEKRKPTAHPSKCASSNKPQNPARSRGLNGPLPCDKPRMQNAESSHETHQNKGRKVKNMTKAEQAQNKQEYRDALESLWGDDKGMIDYCMKQAEIIVKVGQYLLPIEKRKIDKHFCFGYSDCGQGQDYFEALKGADNARNNPDYFKGQNLKYYRKLLDDIDHFNALALTTSCEKDSSIRCLTPFAWWEVLDAVGGEARMDDLKGTLVKVNGQEAYILTDEDRQIIRDAYIQAMKAQEKRLDSYLKRYGISKISVWTYWLDD